MSDLDEIKRDMEAGTKGPWRIGPRYRAIVAYHETGYDDENSVDAYAGHLVCESVKMDVNARRIARVPDMEATIIAQAATIEALRARVAKADELAKQAEHVCRVLKDDNGHAPIRLDQALAAYRATGGAA